MHVSVYWSKMIEFEFEFRIFILAQKNHISPGVFHFMPMSHTIQSQIESVSDYIKLIMGPMG